ncbi:DNA -binding domain-containing protein [Sedimenticola sp.]|uniref:DNA -binding domain-containing protein n=1 Tax=Sedimenticola sp. TaxID=1940285 RepID=UPI003D095FA6
MDEPCEHWHPGAAYLYVLHLDGPGLAWEYLRRHPDYRRDWSRRRSHLDAATHWGLRLLEDPALDAREALPVWRPDHGNVIQLHPDLDPPPDAEGFCLWRFPGRKRLVHDGRRLLLATRRARSCLHLALAPGLREGMAYVHALRTSARRGLVNEVEKLLTGAVSSAAACARPTAIELLELHTLQALDGTLAGASLRTVARALFGKKTVDREWHADSPLRARVRRLVRRGRSLIHGGYRQLVPLPVEEGRSGPPAKRP